MNGLIGLSSQPSKGLEVVKKQSVRTRHIPQRTCVGCREILAKRSLTRVVRTDTGIKIDSSGKMPGRGAYIHDHLSCWQSALKGSLAKALRIDLTESDRQTIMQFMQKITDDSPQEGLLKSNG